MAQRFAAEEKGLPNNGDLLAAGADKKNAVACAGSEPRTSSMEDLEGWKSVGAHHGTKSAASS